MQRKTTSAFFLLQATGALTIIIILLSILLLTFRTAMRVQKTIAQAITCYDANNYQNKILSAHTIEYVCGRRCGAVAVEAFRYKEVSTLGKKLYAIV